MSDMHQSYVRIRGQLMALVNDARSQIAQGFDPADVAYDLAQDMQDRRKFPQYRVANIAAVAVVQRALYQITQPSTVIEILEDASTGGDVP
jgi:hypothetical protein